MSLLQSNTRKHKVIRDSESVDRYATLCHLKVLRKPEYNKGNSYSPRP